MNTSTHLLHQDIIVTTFICLLFVIRQSSAGHPHSRICLSTACGLLCIDPLHGRLVSGLGAWRSGPGSELNLASAAFQGSWWLRDLIWFRILLAYSIV